LNKIHNDAHKALKYPDRKDDKKKKTDINLDEEDDMATGYMDF
jgi:hypothetical protein